MLDILTLGAFLDHHNGAVTAVATAFIALFTIVLAYVTTKQISLTKLAAEAAKKSADALLEIERAWLTLDKLTPLNEFISSPVIPTPYTPRINFSWSNIGHSPAWIIKAKSRLFVIDSEDSLSREPDYLEPLDFPPGVAIMPGTHRPQTAILETDFDSDDEIKAIREGKKVIVLNGFVKYRDIFEREHDFRYGLVWHVAAPPYMNLSGWQYCQPHSYNRQT